MNDSDWVYPATDPDTDNQGVVWLNWSDSTSSIGATLNYTLYVNGTKEWSGLNTSQYQWTIPGEASYLLRVDVQDNGTWVTGDDRVYDYDASGPAYTNLANNGSTTRVNGDFNVSVTLTDPRNISAYWVETNASGAWVNGTIRTPSPASSMSVSEVLTNSLAKGQTVGARFHANDSLGNPSTSTHTTFTVADTPQSISLTSPQDNDHDNGNLIAAFTLTDPDSDAFTCTLTTNGTARQSITNAGPSDYKLNWTSPTNGEWQWNITCGTVTSATRTWVYDNVNPDITWYYPSLDGSTILSTSTLNLNISGDDQYLFEKMVNVTCGGTNYYTNFTSNLNVTLDWTRAAVDLSGASDGTCAVNVTYTDDHTARRIRNYQHWKTNNGRTLNFKTENRNISFTLLNARAINRITGNEVTGRGLLSDFTGLNTTRQDDRYTFQVNFNPRPGLRNMDYEVDILVHSDADLVYRSQSPYTAHFVTRDGNPRTPENWIDFEISQFEWVIVTPISPKAYKVRIRTPMSRMEFHSLGGLNIYSEKASLTLDRTPPSYSNVQDMNGTAYSSSGDYTFNITWTDTTGSISDVLFQWQGTNETPTSLGGGKYQVTKSNLAAGTYTYKWFANDTAGLWNQTSNREFTLSKASSGVNLTLNGNVLNVTNEHTSPLTAVSIKGQITTTGLTGNVVIYSNGTIVGNSSSPNEFSLTFATLGRRNITAVYHGNENYTSSQSTSLYVDEVDTTGPVISITSPTSSQVFDSNLSIWANYTISEPGSSLNMTWWNLDNGTNTTSTGNFLFNTTEGAHTLYLYANDTYNNRGSSQVTFIVDMTSPTINGIWPSDNSNYNSTYTITFSFNATEARPGHAILYTNATGTWATTEALTSWSSNANNTKAHTFTANGSILWAWYVNDTAGNGAWSTNRTLIINKTGGGGTSNPPSSSGGGGGGGYDIDPQNSSNDRQTCEEAYGPGYVLDGDYCVYESGEGASWIDDLLGWLSNIFTRKPALSISTEGDTGSKTIGLNGTRNELSVKNPVDWGWGAWATIIVSILIIIIGIRMGLLDAILGFIMGMGATGMLIASIILFIAYLMLRKGGLL